MTEKIETLSLKELAGLISSRLLKYKIDAVLTGGSCVSIYSNNKYQSFDLDFVSSDIINKKIVTAIKQDKKNKNKTWNNQNAYPDRLRQRPPCRIFSLERPTIA